MIILINSKLTDKRLWKYERYNLHFDDRLDVAKYCFASFAPLAPLVSKFMFYLDIGDFGGREQELEDWVYSVLPREKVNLHWYRLNNIAQWREVYDYAKTLGDDLILPGASWEDHIFWDSSLDTLVEGMELIRADSDVCATIPTSHYPEGIRYAVSRSGHGTKVSDNYALYTVHDDSSQRIMKMDFFEQHVTQPHRDDATVFRVEQMFPIPGPFNKLYQPTRELLRHFDGYSHVGMGGDLVPPISIPPGFFEHAMTIRYGFDDYDPTAVNINPLKPLRTVDASGTDYRFTLDDMPLFWRAHIKEILIAPGIDNAAMIRARNQYYTDMIKINFSCAYGTFDSSTSVPTDWISAHMIELTNTN